MFSAASCLWFLVALCGLGSLYETADGQNLRVATFNASLYRARAGQLLQELVEGRSSQARKVAEILQTVRPDVILINEFDFDPQRKAVETFRSGYLEKSQNGLKPIQYAHQFVPPVNTGVPSGLDLDQDGKPEGPGDAFGFGQHPGQYGFVVLSRFPIHPGQTRTFQNFLWKDMPDSRFPRRKDGTEFYPQKVKERLRLSSKNHCDVVIEWNGRRLHLLASHPTPPVFDGDEDRNGLRNHDEIRFWNDYVSPGQADYIYDDQGRRGGLAKDSLFVIAGDLNADPQDGDSSGNPIQLLASNPLINFGIQPGSEGSKEASGKGRANRSHRGDPALDTADFNDETVGNLRLDYVLPSASLKVKSSGVFWPSRNDRQSGLISASDHRLVWIDLVSGDRGAGNE